MEKSEARSAVKAIYLQVASLAGLEATGESVDYVGHFVDDGFGKITPMRRPEAVANLLLIISTALRVAQDSGDPQLNEGAVATASKKLCPVFPFD
jgi:hypothetical protein